MSNQSYSNQNTPYWVSARGTDNIYFNKNISPALAYLDHGVLYELTDGHLYFNGNQLDGQASTGPTGAGITGATGRTGPTGMTGATGPGLVGLTGTDKHVARFNGVDAIQDSNISVNDNGDIIMHGATAAIYMNNSLIGNSLMIAQNAGNSSFGINAMSNINSGMTGIYNTCVGIGSGASLNSGSYNVCIGPAALDSAISSDNCVAIGKNAATNFSGLSNVTSIGTDSLISLVGVTGNFTALGYRAGSSVNASSFGHCLFIDNDGINGDNNVIRIGNNNHSNAYIAAIYGNTGFSGTPQIMQIDSSNKISTTSQKVFWNIVTILDGSNQNLISGNNLSPFFSAAGDYYDYIPFDVNVNSFVYQISRALIAPESINIRLFKNNNPIAILGPLDNTSPTFAIVPINVDFNAGDQMYILVNAWAITAGNVNLTCSLSGNYN